MISDHDIQNTDLTYHYTPKTLPKWLSGIGQQRLAAHGEANRQDATSWNTAPYFSDLSKVNWLGQTAANYTSRHEIAHRFYLGAANADPRVQHGAFPENDAAGTYPFYWFNTNTG